MKTSSFFRPTALAHNIICIALLFFSTCALSQSKFVTVQNGKFLLDGKTHNYIGTNYWYAGLLGNSEQGKKRLKKELDFLKAKGVENVRVMAAVEGEGLVNGVQRVQPAYQSKQGVFNDALLTGLDYLLAELGKRNMKAVLFISNNWEWSGGFLQYLNWNNLLPDSIMRRKLTWDENRDYVSKFYSCTPCKNAYDQQLEKLVKRQNTITGKSYTNDEAIMAWELGNEPRPMRPAAVADYKQWIAATAAKIKSLDKNHLVTTGAEGDIGTETMEVYQATHADKNIDYLTIHIWPKNWSWFTGEDIAPGFDSVLIKTRNYIDRHEAIAKTLCKPLVIEEFGLPRDLHQFNQQSSTIFRDRYFKEIFTSWQNSLQNNGMIAGVNFWAFGGTARPKKGQVFWKSGDDYMGDPPMEEQGLNTVFDKDKSTWKIVSMFTKNLPKK